MKISKPFACLALVLLATAVWAQGKPVAVLVDPIQDAGTVRKGELIERTFKIRNEGDEPLRILEVKPSCGCTVADYDRTIRPGAVGTVKAAVKSAGFDGPIAKSVTVRTNDAANPRLELVIKANVSPYVRVRPGYARYLVVEGGGAETSTQTLSSQEPGLAILSVESPFPYLQIVPRRADEEEGETHPEWKLEMTLAADAPVGPLASHAVVRTNHPKQPTLQIPVSGFVRPVIGVSPPRADFGERQLKEPAVTSLQVRNFSSESVALTSARSSVRGLKAEIRTLNEGTDFELVLTLDPGMPKGPFTGTLVVETTSKQRPRLEIELTGTVL